MDTKWAFWSGVAATAVVFFMTGATTVQLDATASGPRDLLVTGHTDQGVLGGLLSAVPVPLGTVRVVKRSWGLVDTYMERVDVVAAALADYAGTPLAVQVRLQLPGTIVATNATGRDGQTLVWASLPSDGRLWAQSRVVQWPVVLLVAVVAILTFVRSKPRRATGFVTARGPAGDRPFGPRQIR
ncbi:MAG TPA: hypothetical protein VKZ50_21820 [bacterium]|nr:hypothetical protein [bacterium]